MPDTRRRSRRRRSDETSDGCSLLAPQDALHFELLPADAMCLVPMDLSPTQSTIRQPNGRLALSLPPAAGTVDAHEAVEFADRPPAGDSCRLGDGAYQRDSHPPLPPTPHGSVSDSMSSNANSTDDA